MNIKCPHCSNEDKTLIEKVYESKRLYYYLCGVCSKRFVVEKNK
jgi:transposase-like protein